MANYFDKVLYLYPNIQRVAYWYTQYDGTPWSDPYDGLIWENTEIEKPSKATLDALDDATVETELANRAETARIGALVDKHKDDLSMKNSYNIAKQSNSELTFRKFIIDLDSQEV
jgi:hypothetical protein